MNEWDGDVEVDVTHGLIDKVMMEVEKTDKSMKLGKLGHVYITH